MNPAEFRQSCRKGKTYDIVLLRGPEEYLLREVLDEYLKQIIQPDAADFDYSELRGSDVDGKTLWNAVTTLPLLADRRVVVLDGVADLKADAQESLLAYTKRPSASTTLVMLQASDTGREERAASLPNGIAIVEFKILSEGERLVWASTYAKRRGKTLGDEAAQYLIEASTKSLSDLVSKLDHAILYAGDDPEISVQILMKISGVSSEYTIFQLEDAILRQRPIEAHKIARSLLDGGEAMLRLIATHRGFLLRLWQISGTLSKPEKWHRGAESEQAYQDILKRQIFKLNDFKKAARQIGSLRIRSAVRHLLELEVHAKSGSQEPYRYYEWLWSLTAPVSGTKELRF